MLCKNDFCPKCESCQYWLLGLRDRENPQANWMTVVEGGCLDYWPDENAAGEDALVAFDYGPIYTITGPENGT